MDDENIFLQAVEIDSPEARDAFLDETCGNDYRLRASVESLLAHHADAGRFLESPPAELQETFVARHGETLSDGRRDRTLDSVSPSAKPGCIGELGPYEIQEVI